MFTTRPETDRQIIHKTYELWRKANSKQIETSERLNYGLNLVNPHGYEHNNELDS